MKGVIGGDQHLSIFRSARDEMKTNVVREKSYDFALRIVEAYKTLVNVRKEFVLSKQVLRSGTSIGANVEEADHPFHESSFQPKYQLLIKRPVKQAIG